MIIDSTRTGTSATVTYYGYYCTARTIKWYEKWTNPPELVRRMIAAGALIAMFVLPLWGVYVLDGLSNP